MALQGLRERFTSEFGGYDQREVDARRHASASDDIAVAHDPPRIRGRADYWQQIAPSPLTRRALALQKPRYTSGASQVRIPANCRDDVIRLTSFHILLMYITPRVSTTYVVVQMQPSHRVVCGHGPVIFQLRLSLSALAAIIQRGRNRHRKLLNTNDAVPKWRRGPLNPAAQSPSSG